MMRSPSSVVRFDNSTMAMANSSTFIVCGKTHFIRNQDHHVEFLG